MDNHDKHLLKLILLFLKIYNEKKKIFLKTIVGVFEEGFK